MTIQTLEQKQEERAVIGCGDAYILCHICRKAVNPVPRFKFNESGSIEWDHDECPDCWETI